MSSNGSTTTSYGTVEIGRDGRVGRITLSRPAVLNTFSTQLAEELDEALCGFDDDPDVRAVVVDGAGDAFSAGVDLSEHGDHESEAAYEEWVGRRGFDVSEFGSENVANVAWHGAPFAERVVATTFQDEPDAAVETCRRQALGEVYRDIVR